MIKSIVRPKLEYCNTVWDQKCIKNPKEGNKTNHRLLYHIEMVQRRAARWVTGRYPGIKLAQNFREK